MRHIVLIPAHNEEKFIGDCIESVISQSFRPDKLIVINDSSTDSTEDIVKRYSKNHDWISVLSPALDKQRAVGAKVITVLKHGLESVNLDDFDLISKLDADIILPRTYYEEICEHMKSDIELGLTGGQCSVRVGDEWVVEVVSGLDHVRGALKTYRVTAFIEIDGWLSIMDWDTIDEHKLRYSGWKVRTLEGLLVRHLRITDSASHWWVIARKTGKSYYQLNHDIVFSLALSIERMFVKSPLILSGAFAFVSYLKCVVSKKEAVVIDRNLSRFIQSFRYSRLRQRIRRLVSVGS